MTTKATKLVSLGRTTAVKTFTRNNTHWLTARKIRRAGTQGVTTQLSCVAYSKKPQFFAPALGVLAVICLFFSLAAPSAFGETAASPGWSISSVAAPSTFSVGDNALCKAELNQPNPKCDNYQVTARNTGKLATETSPVTHEPVPIVLSDTVPAGLEVQ